MNALRRVGKDMQTSREEEDSKGFSPQSLNAWNLFEPRFDWNLE